MADYIERKAAVKVVEDYGKRAISDGMRTLDAVDGIVQIARALDFVPAADVSPVGHGRWAEHTKMHGFVYCSACKDVYLDEEWLKDWKWGYCPNCGARMDGGVDDG